MTKKKNMPQAAENRAENKIIKRYKRLTLHAASLCILFLLSFHGSAAAQVDISGGMGIDFISSDVSEYINDYHAPYSQKIDMFATGVNFYLEGGIPVSKDYMVALEYAYAIFSKNTNNELGQYQYASYMHKPTLLAYYVIKGKGYKFKLGGGAGVRYLLVDETYPGFLQPTRFSSTGVGLMLKADANTALAERLYAEISLKLDYDMPGDLKVRDNAVVYPKTIESVSTNSFSGGLRLGLTYEF